MRFALSGGGTGGHVYPSIAVAERLREQADAELLYLGTEHGPERQIAEQANIAFHPIPASPVRGRTPWRVGKGVANLLRGSRAAGRVLADRPPDALFATGGYVAAPAGRAARRRRVPILLFLPDVRPGWAVRFLQRYAAIVACSVEESLAALPAGKSVVTGYPVRRQFTDQLKEATRAEAAARFALDPNIPTVLITGGSLGAHHINLVVARSLRRLLDRAQLIHVCGPTEEPWLRRERERLPEWQQERYQLLGYTDQMAGAMAVADVAVTRAGASVLGELPVSGLPAIVIPAGFSDQRANARFLETRGAALSLDPARLDDLEAMILHLLDDDGARAEMAEAMRRLARPQAAEELAKMLRELAA